MNNSLHSICVHNHVHISCALRFCSTSIIELIIYLCAQCHPSHPQHQHQPLKPQKLISSQQRPPQQGDNSGNPFTSNASPWRFLSEPSWSREEAYFRIAAPHPVPATRAGFESEIERVDPNKEILTSQTLSTSCRCPIRSCLIFTGIAARRLTTIGDV